MFFHHFELKDFKPEELLSLSFDKKDFYVKLIRKYWPDSTKLLHEYLQCGGFNVVVDRGQYVHPLTHGWSVCIVLLSSLEVVKYDM